MRRLARTRAGIGSRRAKARLCLGRAAGGQQGHSDMGIHLGGSDAGPGKQRAIECDRVCMAASRRQGIGAGKRARRRSLRETWPDRSQPGPFLRNEAVELGEDFSDGRLAGVQKLA